MTTTGLVISGAGARGAYEAGVLSVLVPRLLAEEPDQKLLMIGTSAGAINTALLCSRLDPQASTDAMLDFWLSASIHQVTRSVWRTMPVDALQYLSMTLSAPAKGLSSVLDSSPLRDTLDAVINWRTVDAALNDPSSWVTTAVITATAGATGQTVAFVEGATAALPADDYSRQLVYAAATLRTEHVVASSAIPVLFRPGLITEPQQRAGWYVDGGVRLNTPIKPALDLGADRIVVVATTPDPDISLTDIASPARPSVFDAAASVLHAALVDNLAEDVRNLRRVNQLLAGSDSTVYRTIPNLYLGPPVGGMISAIANETFAAQYGSWRGAVRDLGLLGRLMGAAPTPTRGELLSFMLFDEAFHRALIELGRGHATQYLGDGPLPWS